MRNNQKLNTDYLATFKQVIDNEINEHPRTLLVVVNLHMPYPKDDDVLPPDFYTQEDNLMSRFIGSLKAKLKAHQQRKAREGIRTHRTGLRYFWVREIGRKSGNKHYHLMLLVNKDAFHCLGRFDSERNNLRSYIQEAWLSGLGLTGTKVADLGEYHPLVHFTKSPLYYLDMYSENYDTVYRDLMPRVEHLAKHHTKVYGRDTRSIGYSLR